ncbi:MAG: DedA family protein [Deltaproteobacteria bacterium]|nr:DedA family protein [Deltaproteobacteria bacterium]
MSFLHHLFDYVLYAMNILMHLDVHLNEWMGFFGVWMYAILFLIVFCETGLVVTPFLPGDSLLFALGALSVSENAALDLVPLMIVLIIAAVFGDAVNYAIGKFLGPKVFHDEKGRWLNRRHLLRAHEFYERYGGKTIILARFMPIVRTFAPFVAGIGTMTYRKFAVYNIIGGAAWVMSFLLAGAYFGDIPAVKHNFHLVLLAIIVISFLPVALEWLKSRRAKPGDKTKCCCSCSEEH